MENFLTYLETMFSYFFEQRKELFLGGVIVVGVVITLMGILKNLKPIKGIKNGTFRKVLLSWMSVLVTFGVTVASVYLNEFKQDHIWALCVVNSVGTILIYWAYENTAIRNLVSFIGRNTIVRLFKKKPKTVEELKEFNNEIMDDVDELFLDEEESESLVFKAEYRDDDLKNL